MTRLLRAQRPLVEALGAAWHVLKTRIAEPYRPERHYMRGPGPKARARRRA